MNKQVRRNFKQYYDRNEVRYRHKFCIWKTIGDYRFIFETAYIKERFSPEYGSWFDENYDKMKAGRPYESRYLRGNWIFEGAFTADEAFLDVL